ncbi:MAG: DUF4870 domain-containing protein [Streptosporangiales bacterium]|nr:DUF4870 domain-containing protein [Streptosporangiales bacterium]
MYPAATTRGPVVIQPWYRVSDKERDGVVRVLHDAYADGRLDDQELDVRIDQALAARTYGELQLPLRDLLPPMPVPQAAPVPSGTERFAAAIMHLSGYASFFLVPLIVYLVEGRRPTYLREQAAEAANFQLTFLLANIVLGVASVFVLPALLFPVIWVGWLVLNLVGGVASAAGTRFRYPLTLRLLR